MDIEENKKLPFLDVLVTKKADNTLGHQVYRKPTHTDRYLHAESYHHPAQKQSAINSLIQYPADTVCCFFYVWKNGKGSFAHLVMVVCWGSFILLVCLLIILFISFLSCPFFC